MIPDWVKEGIKARIGPDLRPYVDRAFKIFLRGNPGYSPVSGYFDRDLLGAIQSNAGEILLAKREGRAEARKEYRPRSEYSVDNMLRSKKILERILPHIESMRQELFGKRTAPFNSITSAGRWLARESHDEEVSFFKEKGDTRQRLWELEGQIERLLKERNSLSPLAWILRRDRTVPVALGNYYDTFPGTKLRELSEVVAELSEQSHFSMQSLFAFILTGIEPVRRLMDITFRGPVTVRDFLDYYKCLPSEYKNSRKKMTWIGNVVYNFIQELGGPPKKKGTKFWSEATKAWNKQRGQRKYDSRDGLKKAYERALKKLPR